MSLGLFKHFGLTAGSFTPPPLESFEFRAMDVAQTWWVEPRAVVDSGAMYVTGIGSFGRLGIWKTTDAGTTFATLGTAEDGDDHNTPSITVLSDGNLLAMWTNHDADSVIRYRKTTTPGDITTFGTEATITPGGTTSYTQAWAYGSEVHLLTRVGGYLSGDWMYIRSEDNGATWNTPKLLMEGASEYPNSKLDGSTLLLYIHGHPVNSLDQTLRIGRIDLTNGDVYTGLGGTASFNIWSGTGTLTMSDFDTIHTPTLGKTRLTAGLGDATNPAALFVEFDTEANASYRHVRWNGSGWDVTTITTAGDPIEVPIGDNWYFAGAEFENATDALVTRENAGTWTLERHRLTAGTWALVNTLASATDRKVFRPYVPIGAAAGDYIVHAGYYRTYTDGGIFAELASSAAITADALVRTPDVAEDWSTYAADERLRWADWLVPAGSSTGIAAAPAVTNDGTYGLSLVAGANTRYITLHDRRFEDFIAELDLVGKTAYVNTSIVGGWQDVRNFYSAVAEEAGPLSIIERVAADSNTSLAAITGTVDLDGPHRLILLSEDAEAFAMLVDLATLSPLLALDRQAVSATGLKQVGFGMAGSDALITRAAVTDLAGTATTGVKPTALASALQFTGAGSGLTRASDAFLSGLSALSFTGWFRSDKATISGDEEIFVVNVHGSTSPFLVWRDDPNGITFLLNTTGGYSGVKVFASTPAMQTEFHLALTVDAAGGSVRGYINGVEDANSPWTIAAGNIVTHTSDYGIGLDLNLATPKDYRGLMSDVRFYTSVLSGASVASIAADRTGQDGVTAGLLMRLRLDEHPVGLPLRTTHHMNDSTANRRLWRLVGSNASIEAL